MDIYPIARYRLRTMRSYFAIVPLLASVALLGAGCAPSPSSSTEPTTTAATSTQPYSSSTPVMSPAFAFPGIRPAAELQKKVRISTTKGDIVVQIDPELGPNAASNFVYLVEKNFYQNTIFHRVIPGFMIQGGDPTGTGRSGPGYTIPDDVVKNTPIMNYPLGNGRTERHSYYPKGWIAMANTGEPHSAGSQFFIMVGDYPLDPNYAVFGHVISGQDVADAISTTDAESTRPIEDVKMTSVTIEP